MKFSESPMAQAPPEWDDIIGSGGPQFYSSRRWHQAMAGLTGGDERVALAWDSTGLRAAVPVFHYRTGPANALMNPADLFSGALGADRSAWEPVTVLGNVSGYGTGPAAAGADLVEWAATASQVHVPGTSVIPYLTGEIAAELRKLWPDKPFLLTSIRVVLPVRGTTIQEYDASLSRSRRELARRERRQLTRGGRVITVEELTDDNVTEFGRLQANTQRRHGAYGDAAFFTRMYRRMGMALAGSVIAFACRHECRTLGFLWAVVHRDTLVARSIGLDYDHIGQHGEYFNLLVHAPVQFCLENGLREIDLSIGSLRQKLLRGGHAIPAWSVLPRPPRAWTTQDTIRHNRSRARQLLSEIDRFASGDVADQLHQISVSGQVEF